MPHLIILSTSINLTFIGSATGINTAINLTSLSAGAIASGDLGLIFDQTTEDSDTIPTMTGWTKHVTTAAGGVPMTCLIASRILVGTETTVTGFGGPGNERWIVMVFRPYSTMSTRTWTLGGAEVTSGNPALQTITASGVNPPVLLVGHMAAGLAISPRTTSPAMTEVAGTDTAHYAHYTIYNAGSTPANNSYDMDDEGSNGLQSGYFTFT